VHHCLTHDYPDLPEFTSKWHIDQFSHFYRAHNHDQQTDHTTYALDICSNYLSA